MTTIETRTVTTSFSTSSELLDRCRELAQRREISMSALIVDALKAELVADEVGSASTNGRPLIGSGWSLPIIAPRTDRNLPMPERETRVEEVRRFFGSYLGRVATGQFLNGVPLSCVLAAEKAFDCQLARSLSERAARIAELLKEDGDGNQA